MRAGLRGTWVVAWQKLVAAVARDRVAQLFLFVLPLGITVVVGAASGAGGRIALAVVEPRDRAVAEALHRELAATPALDVSWHRRLADADRRLARQEVGGVLTVTRRDGRTTAALRVDRGRLDPGLVSGPLLGALGSVGRDLDGHRLAVEVFGADGASPAAVAVPPVAPRIERIDTGRATSLGGLQFAATGSLVLFAFVTTFGTAIALLNDRDEGQLQRLLAAPVPRSSILTGHLVARVAVGGVQVAFVVVASRLLFDVRWGSLASLAVLCAPFVVTAAALGLVAATLLRSNAQGSIVTGLVGFPAAMLAGCFWPLAVVDPTLRAVGHVVPHAWLVDGLLAVAAGAPLADVRRELLVLCAAAAASVALCLWRVPRFLTRQPVRSSA